MSDGLEKRKFQHLECPLEVTVEIVSAMDAPKVLASLHIKSRNISKGGICLETKAIEIVGIIAAFYRLFDMGTTTNNCLGDLVGTVLVSRAEDKYQAKAENAAV